MLLASKKPRTPRQFLRDNCGATVVEFALVAPIFFAMMFSILEAGFYFFATSAIDAANAKAARLIRTGQADGGGKTKDQFFTEICRVVQSLGKCDDRLTVDVQSFSTFAELAADLSSPVCRDADPSDVNAIPYDTGAQREIIRVRVCFLYNGVSPGLGLNLEETPSGDRKMISTSIFRNEPFAS